MSVGIDFRSFSAGARKKLLWLGAVFAAGLGAALWLGPGWVVLPDWLSGDAAIPVRVATVKLQRRPVIVRISGKLVADTVEVRSRLGGKVTEVRFKVGDLTSPGAIVAIVESDPLTRTMAELKAGLNAAREALRSKQEFFEGVQQQLERSRDLFKKNLISRSDVELATAAVETARADAQLAEAHAAQQEAMLAQARGLEQLSRVTTAAGGLVVARAVNPGSTIGERAALLSIADMATLRLQSAIPGELAEAIKNGATVKILTGREHEKTYAGKLVRVQPNGDEAGRSALIEIAVNAPDSALRPEMAAEAVIQFERAAIWLPAAVVVTEQGRSYVYQMAGERVRRREVSLGLTQSEEVEIVAGLSDGDRVIVDGVNLLKPGTRVRAENPLPAEKPSKRG